MPIPRCRKKQPVSPKAVAIPALLFPEKQHRRNICPFFRSLPAVFCFHIGCMLPDPPAGCESAFPTWRLSDHPSLSCHIPCFSLPLKSLPLPQQSTNFHA